MKKKHTNNNITNEVPVLIRWFVRCVLASFPHYSFVHHHLFLPFAHSVNLHRNYVQFRTHYGKPSSADWIFSIFFYCLLSTSTNHVSTRVSSNGVLSIRVRMFAWSILFLLACCSEDFLRFFMFFFLNKEVYWCEFYWEYKNCNIDRITKWCYK